MKVIKIFLDIIISICLFPSLLHLQLNIEIKQY
jgi:hypothetical protein